MIRQVPIISNAIASAMYQSPVFISMAMARLLNRLFLVAVEFVLVFHVSFSMPAVASQILTVILSQWLHSAVMGL